MNTVSSLLVVQLWFQFPRAYLNNTLTQVLFKGLA